MLTIVVPEREIFDDKNNCFITTKRQELQLEHSLISISKWESKWHIPFLNDGKRNKNYQKTSEMMIDYIRCMTVNKVQEPMVYYCLTKENMEEINAYINDPMTATTFSNKSDNQKPNVNRGSFITNEIIYYQMYELGIHHDWEKRHLNRLLTLIRVMAEKKEEANNPKKMSRSEVAKQYRSLSAARRTPHVPR